MQKLSIYFDESCGICKKVRKILMFFNNGTCEFSFAKEMNFKSDSDPMLNRYVDMYSFDGNSFYKGYDSYLQIFRRLKIPFYPFYLIMLLKPVRFIGEKIYRRVAEKRACQIR